MPCWEQRRLRRDNASVYAATIVLSMTIGDPMTSQSRDVKMAAGSMTSGPGVKSHVNKDGGRYSLRRIRDVNKYGG